MKISIIIASIVITILVGIPKPIWAQSYTYDNNERALFANGKLGRFVDVSDIIKVESLKNRNFKIFFYKEIEGSSLPLMTAKVKYAKAKEGEFRYDAYGGTKTIDYVVTSRSLKNIVEGEPESAIGIFFNDSSGTFFSGFYYRFGISISQYFVNEFQFLEKVFKKKKDITDPSRDKKVVK